MVERRRRVRWTSLGLILGGVAVAMALSGAEAAPRAQQAEAGGTYELVDTWRDAPWSLTAGHYGWTGDISSADDTVFILDNRMPSSPVAGRPPAIHELALDGTPRAVHAVPGQQDAAGPYYAQRMDAQPGGRTAHVLSSGPLEWRDDMLRTSFRIDEVAPGGQRVGGFEVELESSAEELPNWRRYVDIAVRDDGRVYLVRKGIEPWCVDPDDPPIRIGPGDNPIYAVDVYSPDGVLLESLTPPPMLIPYSVDVAPDGRVIILNAVPTPCQGQGGGGGGGEPPSAGGGGATPSERMPPLPAGMASWPVSAPARLAQAADPDRLAEPGIILLDPDHGFRELIRWPGAEDVGAGPAGLFVSRNLEIFHVIDGGPDGTSRVEDMPVVVGPTGHVFTGYLRRIAFTLDVPADGRLLAGMNHCYYQGFVEVAQPEGRPADVRLVGELDAPELEGPAYPVRVAAAEQLAVLLGRMGIDGQRPDQRYLITNETTEAQAVQRWSLDDPPPGGQLRSQLGLCPDTDLWFGTDQWLTRDLGIDGEAVYTVDPELLQRRPGDAWPAWTYWPGEVIDDVDVASYLQAVDADAGRVAVLDVGSQRVVIVDEAGERLADWPVAVGQESPLPVDLALDGERVHVADRASGHIVTRDLNGELLDRWPTHDGPRHVAVGPEGDVFVLGDGGFGLRYTPQGNLVASWALPDRDVPVRDIAVGSDGRVYVNFVTTTVLSTSRTGVRREVVRDAGIWVFEPAGRPQGPQPQPRACVPRPDKWAAPGRIPLGATVGVTLTVDGWCPGRYDDAQLLLVMDTSRSMGFDDSLGRAKEAALTMIDQLDPSRAEVGLITFDAGSTLVQPLTRDLGEVRAAVARQGADGDTRSAGALESALFELTGARARPEARQVLTLLTDGVFYDDPLPQDTIDALHAAGVDVRVLVFPTGEFGDDDHDTMELVAGGAAGVLVAPAQGAVASLTRELSGYTPEPGLFERITVIDKVPENMRFIEGSAVPEAVWDPGERTLTWTFGVTMASEQLRMHYRLEPLEVGIWPTNVWARGPYRDALGNDSQVIFPIPEVEVYELKLDYRAYLPWSVRGACVRPRAGDIVLVMDGSSSMLQPTAEGGATKIEAAREAARAFLDSVRLGTGDRVALVEFYNDGRVVEPLSGDRAALDEGLSRIQPAPGRQGTRIDLGLREARSALMARRPAALPVVILLSDGLQNPGGNQVVVREAERLAREVPDTLRYTIGLGQQIDVALLRDALATSPDRYYASPTASELRAIYAEISRRLRCEGQ